MADYYVYAYIDPRNGEPFYIGAGRGKRAWIHLTICKQGSTHFYNKLRKLLDAGVEPIVYLIVENVTKKQAFQIWEPFFIKAIGRRELKTGSLCNLTDGGEAPSNLSPETRARMSTIQKKRCTNPEVIARQSATMKKRCADLEVKARMSAGQKKRWDDPEARTRAAVRVKEQLEESSVGGAG